MVGVLGVQDLPPITVVRWHGRVWSLDNRRLCVLRLWAMRPMPRHTSTRVPFLEIYFPGRHAASTARAWRHLAECGKWDTDCQGVRVFVRGACAIVGSSWHKSIVLTDSVSTCLRRWPATKHIIRSFFGTVLCCSFAGQPKSSFFVCAGRARHVPPSPLRQVES